MPFPEGGGTVALIAPGFALEPGVGHGALNPRRSDPGCIEFNAHLAADDVEGKSANALLLVEAAPDERDLLGAVQAVDAKFGFGVDEGSPIPIVTRRGKVCYTVPCL